MYELGLTEVDDDLLIDAVSEILKTSKWMPRVSEILEIARHIQDRRDNPPVDFVTYRNHCWRYFNEHLFDDDLWESREYKWLKRNGYVGQPANPEFDKPCGPDGQALINWLMSGITVAA